MDFPLLLMYLKSPDDSVHWLGALQRCHSLVCLMRSLRRERNKLGLAFFPVLSIKRTKKWFGEPGELWLRNLPTRGKSWREWPHTEEFIARRKKKLMRDAQYLPSLGNHRASHHFDRPHYLPQNLSRGILTPPRRACICLWVCIAVHMIYYFLEPCKIFAQFLNQSELAWLQILVPPENSIDLHCKAF